MTGSRPLSNAEIRAVINYLNTAPHIKNKSCHERNKAFFLLGISTGLRAGELSSLIIGEVYVDGKVKPDIYLLGKNTKTHKPRGVPVNKTAQSAIKLAVKWQKEKFKSVSQDSLLFPSSYGQTKMATAKWCRIFKELFENCGIHGQVSTHSMRKTFATRLYEKTNCLYTCQELLGHSNIDITRKYIGMSYNKLHEAVNMIAFK